MSPPTTCPRRSMKLQNQRVGAGVRNINKLDQIATRSICRGLTVKISTLTKKVAIVGKKKKSCYFLWVVKNKKGSFEIVQNKRGYHSSKQNRVKKKRLKKAIADNVYRAHSMSSTTIRPLSIFVFS